MVRLARAGNSALRFSCIIGFLHQTILIMLRTAGWQQLLATGGPESLYSGMTG